jgi:hypothetical protein
VAAHSQRVELVTKYFTHGRVAEQLETVQMAATLRSDWEVLAGRIIELSERRNQVVHSAVVWSGAGLVRVAGGALDAELLPVNLSRDEQLRTELGNLSRELGLFATTRVGEILPFAGADQIITS